MTLALENVAIPKTSRTVSSKYAFGQLTVGGPALVEKDVVNVQKATSKLTSALVAYRKRTGDKSKFSVRGYKQADGTDAVGCWKIAEAPEATAAQ
jgi:hypothetical protein